MRDLLNQNRALSPDTIRLATSVLTALFALAALIITLNGLGNLFSGGSFLTGLLQISGGLGLIFGLYLIVRLLAECVTALHRLNDRIIILTDALSPRAEPITAPAPAPAPKKPARKPRANSKPARQSPPTAPAPDTNATTGANTEPDPAES